MTTAVSVRGIWVAKGPPPTAWVEWGRDERREGKRSRRSRSRRMRRICIDRTFFLAFSPLQLQGQRVFLSLIPLPRIHDLRACLQSTDTGRRNSLGSRRGLKHDPLEQSKHPGSSLSCFFLFFFCCLSQPLPYVKYLGLLSSQWSAKRGGRPSGWQGIHALIE